MATTNPRLSNAGFHHLAFRARDYDRSLAFYTEGLGFRLAHNWGEKAGESDTRIALLDIGDGNFLELFASAPGQEPYTSQGVPAPGAFFHLALRTSDVDKDIETVRALGCPVTVEPKSVPVNGKTIRVGFFLGPDGETLEFFQHLAVSSEAEM